MDIIEAYKNISIAAVSDAMDRLGMAGACMGISPLQFGCEMVGRAFTVKYLPARSHEKASVGDFIDDVKSGSVVVLDNAGRTDCTVWGDILTAAAHQKGLAGTVIDGVCRDVSDSLKLNYPIFSKGHYMRTGKDRVDAVDYNVPVQIGGVQVRAGDIIYGSDDGVIVIPQEFEQDILETAEMIEQKENDIRKDVSLGTTLKQARQTYGYHALQAKAQKQEQK
ncbi:Regulator of RNase E activity RraA [Alteribacillus persepolensis]|uniref:Putative 4-hydroxy-4-methyl-2-oxoglutarate aldolase n=1 Tax=Alteribacillus persepolensis TaxID=568899 RepID=A0A1G8AVR9_9BACI|nr:RraA family protein [Alteribacillus persepolensis]SDH24997.1 Regulator of RNase E activity RraA [Alteribacillus persepolensis]